MRDPQVGAGDNAYHFQGLLLIFQNHPGGGDLISNLFQRLIGKVPRCSKNFKSGKDFMRN
jgi:hypothetical protein